MPTGDQASLLRLASSTALDGLDLTVSEARAMSPELFRRVFNVPGLDDVPLVAPGHLDRAPRHCGWYLRSRPAPKNPGPKDRKVGSFELVVKAPRDADGKTVGDKDRKPYGLQAKDPDGARLEALVFLARKAGRKIRASTWTVERVQSLSCVELLDIYVAANLVARPDGKEDARRTKKTRESYVQSVKVFKRIFPDKEIGDVEGDELARDYELRSGRSVRSRYADFRTIQMVLNGGLKMLGSDYRVKLVNPDPGPADKIAWTVDEYDRLLRAADGWLYKLGGAPVMIPGPLGPVQARRKNCQRGSAWPRVIEFLPYTASRHGVVLTTRWVPPDVEPSDGLPLPRADRAWIEVTDDGIYYHRGAGVVNRSNKRRDGNKIPDEFAATVRAWHEQDMANDREFVFHQKEGERYRRKRLSGWTFRRIVKDAGLRHRRVLHHLKDLAVEWADAARMRRETLAAHAATSVKTIANTYGEAPRTALLEEASREMTQRGWRAKGDSRKALAARFAPDRPRTSLAVSKADLIKKAELKKADLKKAASGSLSRRHSGTETDHQD